MIPGLEEIMCSNRHRAPASHLPRAKLKQLLLVPPSVGLDVDVGVDGFGVIGLGEDAAPGWLNLHIEPREHPDGLSKNLHTPPGERETILGVFGVPAACKKPQDSPLLHPRSD